MANDFLSWVKTRNPHEPEFLQAVTEFADSIASYLKEKKGRYDSARILERLTEPERVISFRVVWQNDKGETEINRGYRIQMSSVLGPYKGGLRFHPSVNLSVLKFLAFEQVFKNALTGLPLGGGKGGSDFDPKGKSDDEVMRFCQAFMLELSKHIGANVDVPAGDIGVGGREIGYLFGQYRRLRNTFEGVLTGKDTKWGGSLIRPEATGYGVVYFLHQLLQTAGYEINGKTVLVSGSGNVAQYAVEKFTELSGKVLTMSDSDGYIYDADGIDAKKLAFVMELKNVKRARLSEYVKKYSKAKYVAGKKPWGEKADIILPCATQNELDEKSAMQLAKNKVIAVVEGANMPTTLEAIKVLQDAGILFAPGKAANAGGVAVSGLEMSQNSQRLSWTREEVDLRLQNIMKNIHAQCAKFGKVGNKINYIQGANTAAFVKVAEAMLEQGLM
jgi:glutamate dehydrogenase (NADP+)